MRTVRLAPVLFLVLAASAASTLVASCSSSDEAPADAPPAASGQPPVTLAPFSPTAAQARLSLPEGALPGFGEVPFPSDIYLEADGTIVDSIPGFALDPTNGDAPAFVRASGAAQLSYAMSTMNGFGVTAGAFFRIDDTTTRDEESGDLAGATLDPASLPATEADTLSPGSAALLIDLEAKDAAAALVPASAVIFDNRAHGSSTMTGLTVKPARGIVLSEGHRYAAVVTSALRTRDGAPVGPSEKFYRVREGADRQTAAEKLYGDAVDQAVKLVPMLAGKIVAVAPYTTFQASGEMLAMRQIVRDQAPSLKLSWSAGDVAPMAPAVFGDGEAASLPAGYTATLDAWLGAPDKLPEGGDDPAADQLGGRAHDQLAVVGTAVFEAPNFLQEPAGKGYGDLGYHNIARDAAGKPAVSAEKPTNKIWITVALPRSPMPPGGFPVVMVQHGLGGDRAALTELANTFAAQGWASVAVDAVTHGARATSSKDLIVDKAAFATRLAQRDMGGKVTAAWGPKGTYDGPDGLVDKTNGSVDFFGLLLNIASIRDQLRQSALDYCATAELISRPDLDLGPLLARVPGARFDPTRIGYIGNSLSGILGSMVAGIDPIIKTFVLNVPGGGLITELGVHSPVLGGQLGSAISLNFGFGKDTPVHPAHPAAHLFQQIVDGGDPLLFARHIVSEPASLGGVANPPKNVLQIQVLWDELVTNESNEALARAAGFGLAEPSTGPMTGIELPRAQPKEGIISGFPSEGLTAVMVQVSPATHGNDLTARMGGRTFAHPYGQFVEGSNKPAFPTLAKPFSVSQPYLAVQKMAVAFLAAGFEGQGAPPVSGFPVPVRDFDGDGVPDDQDPAPEAPDQK
jgi:hypothetical protein